MTVSCEVYIDGSTTGTSYTFEAAPRPGDKIQIGSAEHEQTLSVQSVIFVAAGVYDNRPSIQINASTTALGNA